jgi:predicted metal-dependent phosphoesterase TrpH
MAMLKFTRNKLASVYRKDEETLSVHGILEDDIYGLEIDLELSISPMEIVSIRGKWTRMENSQCPRAIPFLQEAVGFRIDADFGQKVQKIVGRKACRHFADLLLECCDAAKDAAVVIKWRDQKEEGPEMEIEEFFGKLTESGGTGTRSSVSIGRGEGQANEERSGGTVIDLHVHSFPASQCSSVSVEELVEEAKGIGLDGICLCDHNHARQADALEELRQKHGYLILGGNEITTDQGDILVFGFEEDIQGVIQLKDLRERVLRAGGFMIAAHPFRGFLTFGIGYLGLTPEGASARPVFKWVDAVEILNSKVSEKENSFAAKVAEGLRLPVTGGSDAHGIGEVGLYATRFAESIRNERDLVAALRKGPFVPIAFRGQQSSEGSGGI